MNELNADDVIFFSSGCYSDYSVCGHFVVMQDVSADTLKGVEAKLNEEAKKMEAKDKYMYDIHEKFISALIRHGYIEPLNVREIHLGNYRELETPWNE